MRPIGRHEKDVVIEGSIWRFKIASLSVFATKPKYDAPIRGYRYRCRVRSVDQDPKGTIRTRSDIESIVSVGSESHVQESRRRFESSVSSLALLHALEERRKEGGK